MPIENETVHQHGPAGEHSHQGTAFTTWLDPLLAIEQARSITQGLSGLEPDRTGVFKSNFEELEKRLLQLDQSLEKGLARLAGQPVVFSHPVYQYLQHRYGMNGRSVHWEPDTDPGTRGWIDFGNLLRECGVVERLSSTAQNELINIVTIFLGLAVGSKLEADKFLSTETLGILMLGLHLFRDREAAIAAFEQRTQDVKATVPADRLLVFDVAQGWEPLCAFLDVPVPSTPFPHHNLRADFWEVLGGEPS